MQVVVLPAVTIAPGVRVARTALPALADSVEPEGWTRLVRGVDGDTVGVVGDVVRLHVTLRVGQL